MSEERENKLPERKKGLWISIFGRGLVRTMLLWFLVLALVPLFVISSISYYNARLALHSNATESLLSISQAKTEHIRYYFDRLLTSLSEA